MNIKKYFASLIVTLLLTTTAPLTSAAAFYDVNSGTSYYNGIMWAFNEGIIQGYGDGSFGPDNCVRRAELVKMILEYIVDGNIGTTGAFPYFNDVNTNDWFYKYVREAMNRGIIEGYSDNTFRPNNCVNRAEAMKIAVESLFPDEYLDGSSSPIYYDNKLITDIPSTIWYARYARFMFTNRLVGSAHTQVDADNYSPEIYAIKFFPDGEMTRKEVAEMLYQISIRFPDSVTAPSSSLGTPTLKTPANNTNYSNSEDKTVTFTWNTVSGADHYDLMIRLPQSSTYFLTQNATSTSSSYKFYIKNTNQGYYWKVRAYDNKGNWKDSGENYLYFSGPSLTVTAGKPTLKLPLDDIDLDNSTTGVNFQFLPTTNVIEYQLGLKMPGDSDYTWYIVTNTSLNTNGYIGYFLNKGTDGFLEDTGNYNWKIRAWNTDRTSYTDSSIWSISYPGNINSGYITTTGPSTGSAYNYGTTIPFSWDNHYIPSNGMYAVQLSCANYSYPTTDHWLEWTAFQNTWHDLDTETSFTPSNTSGFSFNANIYCHWRVVYYLTSGDPGSLSYISDVRNLIIIPN